MLRNFTSSTYIEEEDVSKVTTRVTPMH